jgi:hypothetical protein
MINDNGRRILVESSAGGAGPRSGAVPYRLSFLSFYLPYCFDVYSEYEVRTLRYDDRYYHTDLTIYHDAMGSTNSIRIFFLENTENRKQIGAVNRAFCKSIDTHTHSFMESNQERIYTIYTIDKRSTTREKD